MLHQHVLLSKILVVFKAGSDIGTSEDEGVECSGSNCDSPNPCFDEAKRLDSLLRQNKQSRINLKAQVNKYLNRRHYTPPNSPNQIITQVINFYQIHDLFVDY